MSDNERIAALQAQLDAIRAASNTDEFWEDAGDNLAALLASAPSDALDRVKREAHETGYELAISRVREDDQRDAAFIHGLYDIVKALGFTGHGAGEQVAILDALGALAIRRAADRNPDGTR